MRIIYFLLIFTMTGANFVSAQDNSDKDTGSQKRQQKQEQKKELQKFVDKDGDGFNDNAPDHDGDGIPNGLDPDWEKEQNKFIDLDGDGINDYTLREQNREMKSAFGPGTTSDNQAKGSPQIKSEGQMQQRKGNKGKK